MGYAIDLNNFSRSLTAPTIGAFEINSESPVLSVQEHQQLAETLLYPVPAGNVIHLKWPQAIGGECRLSSVDGKILQRKSFQATDSIQLDLSALESGLYLITVYAGSEVRSFQLVK